VSLADVAAGCEPATGADEIAPLAAAPACAGELASVAALAAAETVADATALAAVLLAAALACVAPLAAGVTAAAAAPEAEADEAANAPDASSAGTVNAAPTRIRLGSWLMKAFGFASNNACDARASVALSCDCVTAIATSFNDCPGRTVY
jgi:hypothetical protein